MFWAKQANFATLVAEIEYNPRNAILFTQNLSDAYRYILKSQQEGVVTWREEMVSLEELERAPGGSASPPSGFLI